MVTPSPDPSSGYEEAAERFISGRNSQIGAATVREWCQSLVPGGAVLDLGCGHGVPIAKTLIEEGFRIYGVDGSKKLIATFREQFPSAQSECSGVAESEFFQRTFDGVLAWGLLFLLPQEVQTALIHKVAKALNSRGKFLFTAPREAVLWPDALTGRLSVSLGKERYLHILAAAGLELEGEGSDEGENHYYFCRQR